MKECNRLLMFERKVQRKIFGSVRDTNTGEWRRRYNRELEDLYGETNIVGIMKAGDSSGSVMWHG